MVSQIVGLEAYGCDLAEIARILAKKLGTGAAAMLVEYKELSAMGITVQGDVTESLTKVLMTDLAQYNIPEDAIIYEDGGNKKNRTMGNGR